MSSDPVKHSKLESERFWMRTLTSEDVSEKYLAWLADDETLQWLNARYRENNEANVQAYVEQFDNINSFHLGIFVKNQELHIGNFSISIDPLHDTAHVSVLVGDRDWWGKGVVLEARSVILDWLFEERDIYKVWSLPFVRNAPAIFNYKRQGFVVEGILKGHKKTETGERLDVASVAIYRDFWLNRDKK